LLSRYDDYGTRRGGKNGRVMRGGSGYGGGYDRSSRYYPYGGGGGYAGRGGPPMGYRSGGDGYGYGGERQRPNPNKVYMRGLPFRVTPSEVEDFFNPLICVDIRLGVLPDGKSSGDGKRFISINQTFSINIHI
jgi:hypothetical protein